MKSKLIKTLVCTAALVVMVGYVVAAETSDDYQNAKKEWRNTLQDLKTKRKTVAEEIREANLNKAKTLVERAIERAISRLQKIKDRISKMKTISNKEEITAELDKKIKTLKELKEELQNVDSKDQLKTVVVKLRKNLAETRTYLKKIRDEILTSHITKTLSTLNKIATKLEQEISTLKTQGEETKNLESSLEEAKKLITQAQEKNQGGDWKEARRLAEKARTKLAKLAGEIKSTKAKTGGTKNETK